MSNEAVTLETTYEEQLRRLPSVDELAQDFHYLLGGIEHPAQRKDRAAYYSGQIRQDLGFPNFGEITLTEAKQQNESRIFVGAISVISQEGIMKNETFKRLPRVDQIQKIQEKIMANRELQGHIEDYVLFNYQREDFGLFRDLEKILFRARQTIYGDSQTSVREAWKGSGILGLLAESKVVSALQQEWPGAGHASVNQDLAGVDVVVPRRDTLTGLQIKCIPKEKAALVIDTSNTVPKVFVPMDPKFHNPFKLNGKDTETISAFIKSAPLLPRELAA